MKTNKFLSLCIALQLALVTLNSNAQDLAYDDIVNLQKGNIEKAKSFLTSAGWNFSRSTRNIGFDYFGYDLDYNKVWWSYDDDKYNSEKGWVCFMQKEGYENIVIYYTYQKHFNDLESEAKTKRELVDTKVEESQLISTYRGDIIEMRFAIIKTQDEYYGEIKTTYAIVILNNKDLEKRIVSICSKCKGKGYIMEHIKCSYCNGDGIKSCMRCKGEGKLICEGSHCINGRIECVYCNAGNSKISCRKCNGYGTMIGGFVKCRSCSGTGKVAVACSSCNSKGSVVCTNCSGKYSWLCDECNGSGKTKLICNSCNGTGHTREEIKKVCPVCNGTKLSNK